MPRKLRGDVATRSGVMVAAALRHGLSTLFGGVGDRGIELCKGRVLVLCYRGIVPSGALLLSAYMHTGEGRAPENWQVLSTVAHLASTALHHGRGLPG